MKALLIFTTSKQLPSSGPVQQCVQSSEGTPLWIRVVEIRCRDLSSGMDHCKRHQYPGENFVNCIPAKPTKPLL